MEVEPQQYADEYEILEKLGDGSQATVYLGRLNGTKYALKVYKPGVSNEAACKKEVYTLGMVEHKNVIKMISHNPSAAIKLNNHPEEHRPLVAIELCEGGELFDYLAKTGRFRAELARSYIKQLIDAIKHLDSISITHRDLKPENILFDRYFTLKLSDFGFARNARGDHGDYELRTRLGTPGFQAPQIERGNYEGLKVDMFALGVTLFIMYAGTPPFFHTLPNDRIYGLIRSNNYGQFWQLHDRAKPPGFYTDSFKRLINSFLSADPERRPSFAILDADLWLNGESLTQEQIFTEMSGRAARIGIPVHQPNIEVICNHNGYRADLNLEDESTTKEDLFVYYYNHTNIKIDSLPKIDLCYVTYVKKQPNFIVSWLHYYMRQQRDSNNVFLNDFVEEIKLLQYEIVAQSNGKLSIKLKFEIGKENQTDLVLAGQLIRSSNNQVGIKWKKQGGNRYWLSEVQAHIDLSLIQLH